MNEIVKKNTNLLPALMKEVEDKIIEVRGQKTLLDFQVAALYGVETKRVNEAVRNNPRKFPEGYVFELTKEESAVLRSKNSTIDVSPLTIEQVNGKGRHPHRYCDARPSDERNRRLRFSENNAECFRALSSVSRLDRRSIFVGD